MQLPEDQRADPVGGPPEVHEPALSDRSGKPDFDALVAMYEKKIYDILYRALGDRETANDLTQETFISAHRHYDRFRGDKDVYTWLSQIARNLVTQHRRKHEL